MRFIADSAVVTVVRPLASSVYGSYSLEIPEYLDPEDFHQFEADGNELGFVAQLRPEVRTGGFARRFVRADVSVVAEDPKDELHIPTSDVHAVLTEARDRVSEDFFLESDISDAGLGPWVPYEDFQVGDLVEVEIHEWVVVLPVTRIEPIVSDSSVVGWTVHVGGQLMDDTDARVAANADIYKRLIEDRRDLAGLDNSALQKVEDLREETQQKLQDLEEASTTEIGLLNESITQISDTQSTLSTEIEGLSGDLDATEQSLSESIGDLATTTGAEYQEINTKLWGDQGELNLINTTLWDTQSGWNATQERINTAQTAINDAQDDINETVLRVQDANTRSINANNRAISLQRSVQDDMGSLINQVYGATVTASGSSSERVTVASSGSNHELTFRPALEDYGDADKLDIRVDVYEPGGANEYVFLESKIWTSYGDRSNTSYWWSLGFDTGNLVRLTWFPSTTQSVTFSYSGSGTAQNANWLSARSYTIGSTTNYINIEYDLTWTGANNNGGYLSAIQIYKPNGTSEWRYVNGSNDYEYGIGPFFGDGPVVRKQSEVFVGTYPSGTQVRLRVVTSNSRSPIFTTHNRSYSYIMSGYYSKAV